MANPVEEVGVAAYGDCLIYPRPGRDPRTGREIAIHSLSRGGFLVVDPFTRSAIQVEGERPFHCGWAVAQAPDGTIYQCDYGKPDRKLCAWRWDGPTARVVAEPDVLAVFTIDVAPDGRVYIPDYTRNQLHRFDPKTRQVELLGGFKEFTEHIRDVACGRDGLVYLVGYSYVPVNGSNHALIAFDPATGKRWSVETDAVAPGLTVSRGPIVKDADGHVLVDAKRWGNALRMELVNGRAQPIDPTTARVNEKGQPLAFAGGDMIRGVSISFEGVKSFPGIASPSSAEPAHAEVRRLRAKVEYVGADMKESPFDVSFNGSPLRIFSIAAGGGRIWGGTFIPLTLFSYDIKSNTFTGYDNPTPINGEIYNMAWANHKLYMASYVQACLTRFDPAKPYRKDDSAQANPKQLGRMKEDGLHLHRIHGVAQDKQGNVYFAAYGDYGCRDGGICRIDPRSDAVTRWIYAETSMDSMVYLPETDRLLVCEMRGGEKAIRFTIVNPQNGSIEWSEPMIQDQGAIHSWVYADGMVYGMHAYRATMIAFDPRSRKIVNRQEEMRVGEHCRNAMTLGPDGRLWGLTTQCVFALSRDFKQLETIAEYPDHAEMSGNRYGLCWGDDGCLYFPNGTRLMRIRPGK